MSFKREKKEQNAANTKKIIIIAAAVVVVLFGCFSAAGALLPKDKIANNVSAGSTDLGGMTIDEASEALASDNFYAGKTIGVTSNGYKTQFSADDIALAPDPKKTAELAFEVGKSKNIFKNSCEFFKLLFSKTDVGYVPSANEAALGEILYSFGTTFNGEFTDYQVSVKDEQATVTPRIAGQDKNTELAQSEVISSIAAGVFSDIPVTLNKAATDDITVDELYEKIHSDPADAEYVYDGNDISIKQQSVGVDVDKEALSEAVKKLNSNETATIPVKTVMPSVTAESLKSKLFNTTLSSYSTTYSTKAANRASNIALAASKINGKVLKPGETFSYNGTIGDTTIANGYKVAPVFENGKTSEGVGGGICQVSSTLYSAVLYADLKVVERRNHSLTVAYVPKGQDATVSYGSIDFKFSNNTGYPIKISAATGGGTVTVSLIGTKRDTERTVQLKHTIVTTNQPTTHETPDPNLPAGTKKVTSAGKTGYVVDTVKTVIENGAEVSSSKITRSTYKMVPTEVSVGTKQEAPVYAVPSPAPTDSVPSAPAEAPTDEVIDTE